jgi:hypothetical protein
VFVDLIRKRSVVFWGWRRFKTQERDFQAKAIIQVFDVLFEAEFLVLWGNRIDHVVRNTERLWPPSTSEESRGLMQRRRPEAKSQ